MTDTTTQPTTEPAPTPASPAQDTLSTWESIAALLGKFINDETAVGKAGKAAKWSALAVIVIALLTAFTTPGVATVLVSLHWGALVLVANVLLVLLKNIFDSGVKNI